MIEIIPYQNWKKNLRLTSGDVELVITLEVGPRIIRAGFIGQKNLFKEFPEQIGQSGENEWKIRGGHRFWTAPENDESYALDNTEVTYREIDAHTVEIVQPAQTKFGWQKTLQVSLRENGAATVKHFLKNVGKENLKVTPWSLSVMNPGGFAVIPQPKKVPHPLDLPPGTPFDPADFLPNRKMVLWKYTDLSDPRFTWGQDFWIVQHSEKANCTKFGLRYANGWVAYQLDQFAFAKLVPHEASAVYPDDDSNFELFTNKDILELETLAPVKAIAPGQTLEHTEQWRIRKVNGNLRQADTAKAFFGSL